MGTSSIYKGPGGSNKLLPDWLQENNLTETEKTAIASEWKAAKTTFTKAIKSSNSSLSKAFLVHFVKAHGGSAGFVKSSVSFNKSFEKLFSFAYDLGNIGYSQTVNKLGDTFRGKDIEEILLIFSNEICPSGNTKEESATREAMTKTFQLIYEELSKHEQLDVMDNTVLNIILRNYIGEYIIARILSDLGSSFETTKASVQEVKEFETKVRELIKACVDNKVGKIDFINIDCRKIRVEDLLLDCIKELTGE